MALRGYQGRGIHVSGTDRIILGPEVRQAVLRQVVQVARHEDRLVESGQHLNRRLLLYGPPGWATPTWCGT